MEKKKGLVFDSQRYFARFLKYEFRDDFVFDSYKDITHFDNSLEGYDVVIFMLYSDNEITDLMRLHKRGVPIIASYLDQTMKSKLKRMKGIYLFDCTKVKAEMRLELGLCIDLAL
ncbi:hypothetical protein [Flavobacterium sp. T12S277]|uniref:hypothetical protein n=1 Tax=Flavobacterium sp. T12S277 TaxID=3402752 RepID=UPI003AEB6BE9